MPHRGDLGARLVRACRLLVQGRVPKPGAGLAAAAAVVEHGFGSGVTQVTLSDGRPFDAVRRLADRAAFVLIGRWMRGL